MLISSTQAELRMSRLNISFDDADIVARFGQIVHRAGADFIFLGKRDLDSLFQQKFSRLIGTVLVFSKGVLVTAYRDKRAISSIKRKRKQRPLRRSKKVFKNTK